MKYLAIVATIIALSVVGFFLFKDKVNLTEVKKTTSKQSVPLPKQQEQKELTLNDIAKLLQSSPSAKQTQQILEEVKKISKQGNKITLNDCKPDPQVLSVTADRITISNTSTKEIKLTGSTALKKTIPAGQDITLKIDPGLYIYSCEPGLASIFDRRGLIYKIATSSGEKSIAQQYRDQAVDTTVIEFNECEPNNKVIKINSGDEITLKNNNSFDINFYFSQGNNTITKISSKQTISVTPILQGDLTWYGCFAKDITTTTGVIVN